LWVAVARLFRAGSLDYPAAGSTCELKTPASEEAGYSIIESAGRNSD
jgi:hypothetical protein